MIFSSKGPRDELSESIYNFLLDAVARNNGSTDKLEVSKIIINIVIFISQIEAKFGLIIDKGTNERIQLPVMSECSKMNFLRMSVLYFLVLNHEGWTNFVSDMPLNLHKTFNEALNKRFADRNLVKTIRMNANEPSYSLFFSHRDGNIRILRLLITFFLIKLELQWITLVALCYTLKRNII